MLKIWLCCNANVITLALALQHYLITSMELWQYQLCHFLCDNEIAQNKISYFTITCLMQWDIPNQQHLLNKYQIKRGFSCCHGIEIFSGINILTPYLIDIAKWCGFCKGKKILFISYWYFFYQLIMILEDGNNVILHIQEEFILKYLVELPLKLSFKFKF